MVDVEKVFIIMQVSASGTQLCIKNGAWAVSSHQGIERLGIPYNFLPLLPLLQRSYQEFALEIDEVLDALGLPDRSPAFPVGELLDFALREGSTYWVDLARNCSGEALGAGPPALVEDPSSLRQALAGGCWSGARYLAGPGGH